MIWYLTLTFYSFDNLVKWGMYIFLVGYSNLSQFLLAFQMHLTNTVQYLSILHTIIFSSAMETIIVKKSNWPLSPRTLWTTFKIFIPITTVLITIDCFSLDQQSKFHTQVNSKLRNTITQFPYIGEIGMLVKSVFEIMATMRSILYNWIGFLLCMESFGPPWIPVMIFSW